MAGKYASELPAKTTFADTDLVTISDGTIMYKMTLAQLKTLFVDTSHPYIVETWSDGTSWYRVWSDKWCEQGGQITPNSDPYTVQFYKEFKDTNYTLQLSVQDTSPTDFALTVASWNTKSTTGVVVYQGYDGQGHNMPMMWEAKGYLPNN